VARAHAGVGYRHERADAAPRPWVPAAPHPGNFSTLYGALFGIRRTIRRYCWAVGFGEADGGHGQNEILHWNGMQWSAR
jgi:hypothetical protein